MLRNLFVILVTTCFSPALVYGDVVQFKSVQFDGEYNLGSNSWSKLAFTIDRPKVGPFSYSSKTKVSFTIDTDLSSRFLRTDLRFRSDWLTSRWFTSTSTAEMYLGSGPLNSAQRVDLKALAPNEKKLAAWIVANVDELIDFALASEKYVPAKSRAKWNSLSRDDTFEKNIRKNLGPYLKSELRAYDQYAKHTKAELEHPLQPALKKLGYYNGKIDGVWGSQTKAAIMNFERDNDLFPDGLNYGSERLLLLDKAKEKDQYIDVTKIKERGVNDKKTIVELTQKLTSANTEAAKLKMTAQLRKEEINRLLEQIGKLKKATNKTAVTEAEIKAIKNDLKTALNKLALFQNESEVTSTKLTQLKAARDEALGKISMVSAERDGVITQLVEALDSKDALVKRVEKLENEKQQLIKELEIVKSQVDGSDFLPVFQLPEEWLEVERFLAVQQLRFCQILSNYSVEAKAAADSKNQLRQNLVATNRDNDIAALLPNGNYNEWVVKVVEIYATPSGNAAFVLRLPCDVTFGSGKLNGAGDLDGSYAATAEFGGLIYNQLSQLSQGDMVLISGKILTYDDIGSLNQRLKFVTNLNGNNTSKTEPSKNRAAPDYFSKINYLSKL